MKQTQGQEKSPSPLGERLRKLRKQRNLTQGQLATYGQVSQPTISQLESGWIQDITGEALARLAKALGTTTDYLLGLTDDPRRPAERDYKAIAEGIDTLTEKIAEMKRHLKGEGGP